MSRRWGRVILIGLPIAAWILLAAVGYAVANDCAEYVKNPRNFTSIPKGLLEDCMRTGYVQAGTTAVIGTIAGGVIVRVITDALGGKGEETPPDARADDPPEVAEARRRRQKCWDEAREYRLGSDRIGPGLKDLQVELQRARRIQMANMIKFTIRAGIQVAAEVIDGALSMRLARLRALGAADEVKQAMQRARQVAEQLVKLEEYAQWVAKARTALQQVTTVATRAQAAVAQYERAQQLGNRATQLRDRYHGVGESLDQARTSLDTARKAADTAAENARLAHKAPVDAADEAVRVTERARNRIMDDLDYATGAARDRLFQQLKEADKSVDAAKAGQKTAREAMEKAVQAAVDKANVAVKALEKKIGELTEIHRQAVKNADDAAATFAQYANLDLEKLPKLREQLREAQQAVDTAKRELDTALEAQRLAQKGVDDARKALNDEMTRAETVRGIHHVGGPTTGPTGAVGSDPMDASQRWTTDSKGRRLDGVYTLHGNYDDPAIIADGMQYVNDLKQRINWLEGHMRDALDCVKENERIIRAHEATRQQDQPLTPAAR